MNKTYLWLSALLLGLVQLSAQASGLYVGLSAGGEYSGLKKNGQAFMYDNSAVKPVPQSVKSVSGTDSAGGASAEFNVGYRAVLSERFLFGVEADAMTGSAQSQEQYTDKSSSDTAHTANQNLRFTVGASVLPAVRLGTYADIFLRAGAGVGQYKLTASGPMYYLANSRDEVKDAFYAVVGLGVDGHLAKHWAMRLEGDYMAFSSFNVEEDKIDDSTPNQKRVYHYKASYTPSVARVSLGVTYDF